VVVLPLAQLVQDTSLLALFLEATDGAVDRLVLLDSNPCHAQYSPPSEERSFSAEASPETHFRRPNTSLHRGRGSLGALTLEQRNWPRRARGVRSAWRLGRDVGLQQDWAVHPSSSPKYSVPGSCSSSRSSSGSACGSSSGSSSVSSSGLGSSFGSGTIAWVLRRGSSPPRRPCASPP